MSDLSEYEKARLLQIEKNKALLASLNISELTATMVATPKKAKLIKEKKRTFKEFAETEITPPRRSARVAGMPVSATPTNDDVAVVEKEDKRRVRREGDFTMESATTESTHTYVFNTLQDITFVGHKNTSSSVSPAAKKVKIEVATPKRVSPRRKQQSNEEEDDKENRENRANRKEDVKSKNKGKEKEKEVVIPAYELKKFTTTNMDDTSNYRNLSIDSVTKTVPDRIYTIALHPSRESIVIAAGDSWGRIGIWNYGTLEKEETENNTCVYKPHCAPVGGLQFCQADSSKLFSASYDGAVRCADLFAGTFTQLHLKDETRTCLDIDPTSSHLLVVGNGDGTLSIVDTRSPKVTEYEVHSKKLHAVSINPGNTNIVATGSTDQTMCVWDVRKMKTAVHHFQHIMAVTSCAFSKRTGKYLVSASYDNHLRVWDNYKLKATINHNCTTGRWITPFRIAWDPKNEDVFACGNMHRSFDIFNASTHMPIVRLADEESLTAIPSLNAFHQYHNVAVSATASGRTYVWK